MIRPGWLVVVSAWVDVVGSVFVVEVLVVVGIVPRLSVSVVDDSSSSSSCLKLSSTLSLSGTALMERKIVIQD